VRIIAFVGKAGSGKDTAAGLIPNARRFSFADPLKEFCAQVFDWDRETLWGDSALRGVPDPRYVRPDGSLLTPRFALQTLGTEWGRECCEDIWVRLGVRRAQQSDAPVVVFTDCRFVNEARIIREAGGEVWRIYRPGAGLTGSAGTHPSEADIFSPAMDSQVTAEINNSGTLEELAARIALRLKLLGD
jgi:hypothetical protein